MQIIQGVPNQQSYIQDMRELYQKFGDKDMQIQKGKAIERTISSTNIGICVDEALKSGELRPKKARKKLSSFILDEQSEVAGAGMTTPFPFGRLLSYAHRTYEISSHVEDYVLVPVPIIISDVPNANGVSFPAKSLSSFSPTHGMPHFKTWVGKPTHNEHQNKDHKKAKGIVIDSVMNPVRGRPSFWKVVTLLAFDRTKDQDIYDDISNRRANAYSMGAYLEFYKCSVCSAYSQDKQTLRCEHIGSNDLQFYTLANGKLVYREAWYPMGFEVSRVDTPAYVMSISDMITRIEGL